MNAASRYAKTQTETASNERILVMLLERALKDIRMGAQAIDDGKHRDASHLLTHASDIVSELSAVLDRTMAPALAQTLEDVYRFVSLRLIDAALKRDAKLAREAERALEPLVDAFTQAVAQVMNPKLASGAAR